MPIMLHTAMCLFPDSPKTTNLYNYIAVELEAMESGKAANVEDIMKAIKDRFPAMRQRWSALAMDWVTMCPDSRIVKLSLGIIRSLGTCSDLTPLLFCLHHWIRTAQTELIQCAVEIILQPHPSKRQQSMWSALITAGYALCTFSDSSLFVAGLKLLDHALSLEVTNEVQWFRELGKFGTSNTMRARARDRPNQGTEAYDIVYTLLKGVTCPVTSESAMLVITR